MFWNFKLGPGPAETVINNTIMSTVAYIFDISQAYAPS